MTKFNSPPLILKKGRSRESFEKGYDDGKLEGVEEHEPTHNFQFRIPPHRSAALSKLNSVAGAFNANSY